MFPKVFVITLTLSASLESVELAWRSRLFQPNESSQSVSLDSSWSFHLGFFTNPFVPNETNSADWCANWNTVDVAGYNVAQNRFVSVWDDDGSVPSGAKGFIWGFNRGALNPEWILLSANDWSWPLVSSNPLDPNGETEWTIDDASEVVVGQVNQGGIHMRMASVTGSPPLLEGGGWLLLHFTASEQDDALISGWEADPDSDGFSNLAEFAFGMNPNKYDQPIFQEEFGSGFFEFTIQKAEKVSVNYLGQVSSDLLVWKDDAASVSLVNETATSLTYRDFTPFSSPARFGRVQVSLTP